MKLELEFGKAFCYTPLFSINGIDADRNDFGTQDDLAPYDAEPYGCGNMTFTPKSATSEVLEKYKINEVEYAIVANQLAVGLSFGCCGCCV